MKWLLLAMLCLLLLFAFLPSNTLTGHVVSEPSCDQIGCLELCDATEECSDGTVCCPTTWRSGVCADASSCDSIYEYSLYQSLEVYQDSVREQPSRVSADWRTFFLPLTLTLALLLYFVKKRREVEP